MDYKQLVAAALAPALPDLTQEAILDKIEQPKTSKQGDLAFPTFMLSSVKRVKFPSICHRQTLPNQSQWVIYVQQ